MVIDGYGITALVVLAFCTGWIVGRRIQVELIHICETCGSQKEVKENKING
jgi:hypothetical protein